jgi:TolA-binding protein
MANAPNWDNRLNAGNRPNIDNRANLGNRSNLGNRMNIGDNRSVNNWTNNIVRPTHGDWNHGDWHHGDWHGNWNNSWYYRPVGWWTAGYWAGAAVSAIPWSWGYWPYYNPYGTGPFVADGATIDYSQPIVVAQAVASPPVTQAGLTAEQQATPLLDAARNAFMQGDYKTALAQADQAIAQVPNDTVLHEFRGLVLFALGRYKEAAAADYAVLSTGPGWDWTTLSGLYPNVDVYTEQLRALEQYAKSHPAASDAKFLLAENYLTCGHTDAAAAQFKEVIRLDPKDQLSTQLLNSISASDTAKQAAPSPPAAPTKPADASSLVGNWTATRADSATIKLALAGDGKFTWALDQNGKPQQFSGTYTVADNLLVFKQGGNPMMAGQVAPFANDRFNFKLAGDNPSDPGLTFVR